MSAKETQRRCLLQSPFIFLLLILPALPKKLIVLNIETFLESHNVIICVLLILISNFTEPLMYISHAQLHQKALERRFIYTSKTQ